MLSNRYFASLAAAGLFLVPLPTADAFGPAEPAIQQTARARLLQQFARVVALSDGTAGIAVRDLATGETIDLNGDTLFPMASTYKVAVAGKILSMVDAGTLRLDKMVDVDTAFLSEGGIADMFPNGGASFSIYNLLDLMLTRSDNGATDMLVAQAGGPAAVNAWLRATGIRGQRVDSNTAQLLYRAMGISPAGGSFRRNVEAAKAADPALHERDLRDTPNLAFADDPRDSSTPRAMLDLLAAMRQGKALSASSSGVLAGIMARCRTGASRIKGMLPPGTPVAHKTGSLNGTGNDVGVVMLPNGRSFAIAVFVMKDRKGHEARDRIAAEAARAAYDYFLYAPDRGRT
ncbi:MAG: class A beta-lactamase [Sphingobium sp.]